MSNAVISWIGGPVLRARMDGPFHMHESLAVGEKGLLGEVIRIAKGEIVAQVYEDTTGLRPGHTVRGTGAPLSVLLGPGLLGGIFDGLLRPLDGENAEALVRPGGFSEQSRRFSFRPLVKEGDEPAPGVPFGEVSDAHLRLRCTTPPDQKGKVVWIAAEGDYNKTETLCRLAPADGSGEPFALSMSHAWPVRRRRPVSRRLPPSLPLITGQRIIDTLFPVARGGRAMLPGGFGTGKTVLQETLAKWSDADVIVYVGCGERGNEMAEVLREFGELEDPRTGRRLMERTIIIANTSNMPVAAREAGIYTGITVGEFFRDQGLHVALMADSTSRWAEALREVSGRLGELPGEGGYPAYLSSRLAEFYERAGHVQTLAGDEGSLTIIGAVSPPAGDFSEPVTTHTKRYVRCFWGLDLIRAQARFYPAIHPLQSYSEDAEIQAGWWQRQGNSDWKEHRRRLLALIDEEARIERLARIVGKDSLPPEQQLVLLFAELVNEGFLRQMATSKTDRYCSPARQTAMLRLIVRYMELAGEALTTGTSPAELAEMPIFRTLLRMGEDMGEERLADYRTLWKRLDDVFAVLPKTAVDHAG